MTSESTSPKKRMSKGCMIALIVAAVIVVILIAVAVLFYVYQDEILQYGLDATLDVVVNEIKADLPEGTTEEEVDRLTSKFKSMVKGGGVESEELRGLMITLQRVMDDKQIDSQEAEEFLDEIKKIVGEPEPAPISE